MAHQQVSRQKGLGKSCGSRIPQALWSRGRTNRRRQIHLETDKMLQCSLAPLPNRSLELIHFTAYNHGYLEPDHVLLHIIITQGFKVIGNFTPHTPCLRAHAGRISSRTRVRVQPLLGALRGCFQVFNQFFKTNLLDTWIHPSIHPPTHECF